MRSLLVIALRSRGLFILLLISSIFICCYGRLVEAGCPDHFSGDLVAGGGNYRERVLVALRGYDGLASRPIAFNNQFPGPRFRAFSPLSSAPNNKIFISVDSNGVVSVPSALPSYAQNFSLVTEFACSSEPGNQPKSIWFRPAAVTHSFVDQAFYGFPIRNNARVVDSNCLDTTAYDGQRPSDGWDQTMQKRGPSRAERGSAYYHVTPLDPGFASLPPLSFSSTNYGNSDYRRPWPLAVGPGSRDLETRSEFSIPPTVIRGTQVPSNTVFSIPHTVIAAQMEIDLLKIRRRLLGVNFSKGSATPFDRFPGPKLKEVALSDHQIVSGLQGIQHFWKDSQGRSITDGSLLNSGRNSPGLFGVSTIDVSDMYDNPLFREAARECENCRTFCRFNVATNCGCRAGGVIGYRTQAIVNGQTEDRIDFDGAELPVVLGAACSYSPVTSSRDCRYVSQVACSAGSATQAVLNATGSNPGIASPGVRMTIKTKVLTHLSCKVPARAIDFTRSPTSIIGGGSGLFLGR